MATLCRSIRALAQSTNASRNAASYVRWYSQEASESTISSDSLVDVEVNPAGVAVVTLQRRPVNSLNIALLDKLGTTIEELEKNKTRGMVLTSASDSVFSAGLDIREMYKPKKDRLAAFWSTFQRTWLSLYRCSFPTVAAINGHAPAGGCLLALSCEYRVMVGPKFTIGLNETQLGIIAPPWMALCMREVIGPRQTEMALTSGQMFSAPAALQIGLIDAMVESKDEAMAEAEKFIARFDKIPPLARKMTKEQVRGEGIRYMEENMIDDLKNFCDLVMQPNIQKELELYLASLKKSK